MPDEPAVKMREESGFSVAIKGKQVKGASFSNFLVLYVIFVDFLMYILNMYA